MPIPTYQPGDEQAQARIYNTVACPLPGFKPTSAEEIWLGAAIRPWTPSRRPSSTRSRTVRWSATSFSIPTAASAIPGVLRSTRRCQTPCWRSAGAMSTRRYAEAWTTYRADWSPVLEYFQEHGFVPSRRDDQLRCKAGQAS